MVVHHDHDHDHDHDLDHDLDHDPHDLEKLVPLVLALLRLLCQQRGVVSCLLSFDSPCSLVTCVPYSKVKLWKNVSVTFSGLGSIFKNLKKGPFSNIFENMVRF